ncbi:hypothetical protein CALCODRAFT_504379 [Calocera cornea HHB12733]|uniref:Uncharacterized protein n=1 Tax=Calocera cornea HHB12733 TaxID=1353952 RepID=A0A165CGD7_9BASI|nr:hypothetical protein CALCODRAFT_504379 [Calocera cornea HHB12733]
MHLPSTCLLRHAATIFRTITCTASVLLSLFRLFPPPFPHPLRTPRATSHRSRYRTIQPRNPGFSFISIIAAYGDNRIVVVVVRVMASSAIRIIPWIIIRIGRSAFEACRRYGVLLSGGRGFLNMFDVVYIHVNRRIFSLLILTNISSLRNGGGHWFLR